MKYVITGPTGSIGMNLIMYLLNDSENELWVICNPTSNRIKFLPENSQLHIITCDIYNLLSLSEKLPKSFDAFIHLAWAGTVGEVRNNVALQLDNVKHYIDAVNLANKHNCKVFVGAGSQAEYGRKQVPITEDMVCNPEMGYGVAKLSACHTARFMCNQTDMRFLWLRFFSVYGPYENFTSLTASTIVNYLKGNVPNFTEATQMWDYSYAKDVAEAISELSVNSNCSGIYNISSGNVRPLREYITKIAELCNAKVMGNFGAIPYSSASVMFLQGDITKLKRDTGCTMSTPFEVGIKEMIEWAKVSINI